MIKAVTTVNGGVMTVELKRPRRTRASAKQAGSRFERIVADYLAEHVDDRIDRKVKTGAADCGDIGGIRTFNKQRVVVECKDTAKLQIGPHLDEAETERVNDKALVGVVAAKRHGVGDPGSQVVYMTLRDLAALLTGERPDA